MLNKMLDLFRGENQETALQRTDRVPLALAVLMMELAHADGHLAEEERQQIVALLQQRFELSTAASDELLQLAHAEQNQSVDLYDFTREINWAFSQDEKEEIAEQLWLLILADGVLAAEEEALMRQISHLIGLAHPRMIDAKLRAREAMNRRGD